MWTRLARASSRSTGLLLLAAALLGAPAHCAAQREPARTRVTAPGDAVYDAAGRLRQLGYDQAYESTLRYIIERYPGSRAAARAEDDLRSPPP